VEDKFNRYISWLAQNTAYIYYCKAELQKIRSSSVLVIIIIYTYINLIGLSDVNFGNHIVKSGLINEQHTILGLHLNWPEKFKTRVTKLGVLYVLHVITTNIPPKFWLIALERLIALEKIKITDISIILERSKKCVINKIEVKILGKNQNGTT
jgi:hypothetical protein